MEETEQHAYCLILLNTLRNLWQTLIFTKPCLIRFWACLAGEITVTEVVPSVLVLCSTLNFQRIKVALLSFLSYYLSN